MMRLTSKLLLAAALLLPTAALADVPPLMPTQGVLVDNAGLPVTTGTYSMTFSLYVLETGGTAIWTESWPPAGVSCTASPASCVQVQDGAFALMLGSHTPLPVELIAKMPELWLGMKVETDPELPRRRVASAAFAFQAANADVAGVAQGLACTDCVTPDALTFPTASADAQGGSALHALSAGVAGDVDCGGCVDLAEVTFPVAGADDNGDATGLACSGCVSLAELDDEALATLTEKYTDGQAVAAVEAAGYVKDTDVLAVAQLPGTGLDEVSNGTISSQHYVSINAKDVPVAIPDFAPPFPVATSTLTVPSLGVAESLTILVDITHPNVGQLVIKLKSPTAQEIVLHNKGNAGQANLYTIYPTPTKPASGDLAQYVGTDVAGTWTLQVEDTVAGSTGTLNAWWVNLGYLSSDTVRVHKNLEIEGTLTIGGKDPFASLVLDCVGVTQGLPAPSTVSVTCNPGYRLLWASDVKGTDHLPRVDCVGKTTCATTWDYTGVAAVYGSCCKPVKQ